MSSSDTEMTSSGNSPSPPPPPPPSPSPSPPSLQELSRRGVRTLLMPFIIRLAARSPPPSQTPREVVVLVNLGTGSISMMEGANNIEALLRAKDGPLPASKASIEAMPLVEVKEEGFECAICLTEFEVNGEAKEMPCKHKYHAGCIEKWLGVHGSCPICRYKMPADEEREIVKVEDSEEGEGDGNDDDDSDEEGEGESEGNGNGGEGDGEGNGNGNGGEGGREGAAFVFHIFMSGSRNGSGLRLDSNRNENENENGNGNGSVDGNLYSGSGSGSGNDGSATQDMEIDNGGD